MSTGLWILVLFVGLILLFYLRFFIPLRKKEPGFEYVYVEENGSVRELNQEEQEYLSEEFEPGDSGRPYIKSRYRSNFFGIHGYILRRRVPFWIKIIPLDPDTLESRTTGKCDECKSPFYHQSSRMLSLCPECTHQLYGYPNCEHEFNENQCIKCGWNGNKSNFIKNQKT